MQPTRIRRLAVLALLTAALGWSLVVIVQGQSGRTLPVPWLAAITIWVLAVALGAWTVISRPRLQRVPGTRPLPPLVAARTAALAMAASRTGSLIAGLYAGIGMGALSIVTTRETPAGTSTALACVTTVIGALVLIVTALWLERMCRLPQDPGSSSAQVGSRNIGEEGLVEGRGR